MKLEKRIFVGFVATIMYFHLVNYAYPADNPYGVIVERNAFELTEALPPASEILALVEGFYRRKSRQRQHPCASSSLQVFLTNSVFRCFADGVRE